jgi:sulfur carrier protein ThiS
MHITVNIYAYLRQYLRHAESLIQHKTWEVPDSSTVARILERLNLPNEVGITVLVNNNRVEQETILKEGDIVHILPQMGGG